MAEEKWVLHNFNYELIVVKAPPPPSNVKVIVITRPWYEMIDKKVVKEKSPA